MHGEDESQQYKEGIIRFWGDFQILPGDEKKQKDGATCKKDSTENDDERR